MKNSLMIKLSIYILFYYFVNDFVFATDVPNVKLNNGVLMPVIGLGTWNSKSNEVTQAVKDAIDAGYRHFDCAWIYGNEKQVGEGLKQKINEGVVKREDLFIVSKLWNTFHRPENVEPALNQSLRSLGLDYLDLYLMHSPTATKQNKNGFSYDDVDYVDTWKAMENVYKKGLTRSIGVSNFDKNQIQRILDSSSTVPVTNQVECHPHYNQKDLNQYCKDRGIVLTAYSPLGSPGLTHTRRDVPKVLDEPIIKSISQKYKKTPAQITLRYLIQKGYIAIPKSVHKNRIQENIDIFNFQLTSEDMKEIDSLDRANGRVFNY